MNPYQYVDDPEVFVKSMPNKGDATLQEVEQLEIAGLECGEMLGAHGGIQITWTDTRELCQVIHHLKDQKHTVLYVYRYHAPWIAVQT